MIYYGVYQGSEMQMLARLLLQQQVHESSGELQHVWERIANTGTNNGRKCLIVLAEERVNLRNPKLEEIDCYQRIFQGALLYEINRSHIQIYVKPKSRRKGLATSMIARLRDYENYDRRVISAEEGYPGSLPFFERNLIYIPDYSFHENELKMVNGELYLAGKLPNPPQPYYGDAVKEIIRRRKRAFLQKVLKAQKAGRI